jgi:hypothetical protein
VAGRERHLDLVKQEKLWFPGGYYFDVPKGAAAVYIGTLRYFRDDFNSITRVEVIDERKDIASVLKAGAFALRCPAVTAENASLARPCPSQKAIWSILQPTNRSTRVASIRRTRSNCNTGAGNFSALRLSWRTQ